MRRSLIEAIEREADLTVCGQAEDAQAAYAAVVSVQPDIVLTDIQLKSSSGLDFIKAIRAHAPTLPVVATTMFDVQRTNGWPVRRGVGIRRQTGRAKTIDRSRSRLTDEGRTRRRGGRMSACARNQIFGATNRLAPMQNNNTPTKGQTMKQ